MAVDDLYQESHLVYQEYDNMVADNLVAKKAPPRHPCRDGVAGSASP
jgi:hypothetical protein